MTNSVNLIVTSDRTFLLECSPAPRAFPRLVARELKALQRQGLLANAFATTHSNSRVLIQTQAFAATNSPGVGLLRDAVARSLARCWRVRPEQIAHHRTRLDF